jgi:hypothetical protein
MMSPLNDAQAKWCHARLAIFRDFRELPAEAKRRYLAKLWSLTSGDREKLKELVADIEGADFLPTLAALDRMAFAKWPPPKRADTGCGFCHGSGFEIIETGQFSGAKRCRCRVAVAVH